MAVLVKTLNGLAYASVKTRNGLAVASIKNINGLDTSGGAGAPSRTYQTASTSITDAATYTFTAQPIGNPGDRSHVVVCIMSTQGVVGRTITAVTIGGNAASSIASNIFDDSGTTTRVAAIYGAVVASGTTADVVVDFSGTMGRCAITVYTVANVSSLTAAGSGSDQNSSTTTLTLSATAPSGNSVAIACYQASAGSDRTMSWTGLTEDVEGYLESLMNYSSASDTFSTSGSKTITTTTSGAATPQVGVSAILQ